MAPDVTYNSSIKCTDLSLRASLICAMKTWTSSGLQFSTRTSNPRSAASRSSSRFTRKIPPICFYDHFSFFPLMISGHTNQLLVPRPWSYWNFSYVMVNVDEASFLCPTFQMLTRRTVPADLIAGCIEYTTEFDDFVVTLRTSIFAVSQRIEVLQLNPASRGEIPDQSAP